MGSSNFLGTVGDAVSQSGPSSHRHHKKRRSRSRSRSGSSERSRHRSGRSVAGSVYGGDSNYRKNNASRGFFGLGNNSSRSSFFGNGRSSYYKRSPRDGFFQRCLKQLKRLLRDLQHYAKRHPWKVFFLLVVPLLTGGALTALLARFGLRIPPAVERLIGVASRAATGDPFSAVSDAVRMAGEYGGSHGDPSYGGARVERGRSGDLQWERRSTYYDDCDGEGWTENIRRGVSKIFS